MNIQEDSFRAYHSILLIEHCQSLRLRFLLTQSEAWGSTWRLKHMQHLFQRSLISHQMAP